MDELSPLSPAPDSPAASSLDERINLRISTADKRIVEGKAAQAGLSIGDYMRRAALGKPIVERIPPELRQQLSLAGSNLNQLTRLANSGKLPDVEVTELNELVTRLLQTLR